MNQEVLSPKLEKIPHLLKYMGSKREILSFVKESISSLDVESEWICDIFSGSSVVAGELKEKYKVHANDVQSYSAIFAKTYFSCFNGERKFEIIEQIKNDVEQLVNQFKLFYPEQFNYNGSFTLEEFNKIEKDQQNLINKDFFIGFHLFSKYYSGTYWSFEQCIWIDSLRAVAEKYSNTPEYYAILSSLIFAMSYASQSTGHYAQYRDASTESSMNDILVYRRKEIWPLFEKKFIELLSSLNVQVRDFKVTTLDYLDCLRIIENNSIVYADPPYQSVHYSRFYHVIETLVKYDYPKVEFKGRYREDRHQSPFCKKTTVNNAFRYLFECVDLKKSHLILSYSDTGMISMDAICQLAMSVFKDKYQINVLQKEHIHSKMGRNDERQQEVLEYALTFKRF